MKFNEIRYDKTFNLGDYQSEKIGSTIVLEDGEDPSKALRELIEFVHSRGITKVSKEIPQSTQMELTKDINPNPTEEKTKVEKPKKEKVTVVPEVKAKTTPYNRDSDLHKKLVGELLDKNCTGWRKTPSKAKDASVKLAGVEFLDSEGLVLKSFSDSLIAEVNN